MVILTATMPNTPVLNVLGGRWRNRLEVEAGPMTPENTVEIMLSDTNSWSTVAAFVEILLCHKKKEDSQGAPNLA